MPPQRARPRPREEVTGHPNGYLLLPGKHVIAALAEITIVPARKTLTIVTKVFRRSPHGDVRVDYVE